MSEINVTFGDSNPAPESPPSESSFIVRLITGLFITAIVMVLSALAWGGIAYATQQVFVLAAIVIGFAVSFGLSYPFSRVSIPLMILLVVPTLILTILTVLAGNMVYYTLLIADAQQLSYSEALTAAIVDYELLLNSSNTIQSVVIACIGALLGVFNLARS